MVDINTIQVQKKDGSLERYNSAKLVASMKNAGATPEEVEKIVADIEGWITSLDAESVLTSDVRTKVIEFLRPLNAEASGKYESYIKGA